MKENFVLKNASEVIRDKYFEFELDIIHPTFLERLTNQKVKLFKVRRATLGTLLYVSGLIMDLKTNPDELNSNNASTILASINSDVKITCKILSALIRNSDGIQPKSLLRFIKRNITSESQNELIMKLLEHSRLENFLSTIILVKGMSLLKTEEMIAFEKEVLGKQSEEQ